MAKQIPPDIRIVLLDEISGKLSDLIELTKRQIPLGIVKPMKFTIGTSLKTIDLTKQAGGHKAVGVTIINDGPDSLYYAVNQYIVDKDFELKVDSVIPINFGVPVIEVITFISDGTSNVKLIATY